MTVELKTPLRAELRTRRRALAVAHPDGPVDAAAALAASAAFGSATFRPAVIAAYHPLGSEFDPEPVVQVFERRGAAVALPVVTAPESPLVFRLRAGAVFAPDHIGVQAPAGSAPAVRPDLVLAPLLAFDAEGGRLGQGGGYYDRTLAELRRTGGVFVLGLGYAGQEVEAVPTGPHDQRLDGVLTERGLRLFAGVD